MGFRSRWHWSGWGREEIVENGLPYREEVLLLVFELGGGFNFGSIRTGVATAVTLVA